jgi:hypothetical protein
MTISQPSELAAYRRDREAESAALRPFRVLGPVVLTAFTVTLLACFSGFYKTATAAFLVMFPGALLMIFLGRKRRVHRCRRCHEPTETVEVAWPSREYTGWRRKWPGLIWGADGHVYLAGTRSTGHRTASYVIDALKQRWCFCLRCRLCFLAVEASTEIYKTEHHKKWKQAAALLRSDPEAVSARKLFGL